MKKPVKIWTMVMGVMTALIIIFSQVFSFQSPVYAGKEIKKEIKAGHERNKGEQKDNAQGKHYISVPSIFQSSSTHVEVEHESAFLLEILFERKEEPADRVQVPLSLGKFFHTLFRVIISPNAP